MTDKIPESVMREARAVVHQYHDPLRDVSLLDLVARALLARDQRAAEIAYLEALKASRRERRTTRLGLKRETYPHEYGQEIRAAILSYDEAQQ